MQTVDMFGGVDGTGPYSDEEYEKGFKNSFVKNFSTQGPAHTNYYIRGPGAVGNSTYSLAVGIYQFAKLAFETHHKQGKYLKIMLAGYSRGGVAVCAAAKFLSVHNIPVHGLFLMDPVDRTITLWGKDTVIPKNVSYVDRTQREDSAGSRESFNTDCTNAWDGTLVETTKFKTTHGGMGGCPWGPDGEAEYYRFKGVGYKDGAKAGVDGYYKTPPAGGEIDYTKMKVILEGFPDGATNINADTENAGYLKAQAHYHKQLTRIRNLPASAKKMEVYEQGLAQKQQNRATIKDYRYRTATGQNWNSTKGQY